MNNIKIENDNKKIAIIYSLDDLFAYVVKIYHRGDSYYVGSNNEPEKFGNIDGAKKACQKHRVEEAYLALSNSYQELDATTDNPSDPMPRYDYKRIYF